MTQRFYIDIENASGTKLGSGPITGATQWRYTARMDRAGEFAFSVPATDAQAAQITRRRVARAYALMGGIWTEVGAGIIDNVVRRPQPDGTVLLEVSGGDLLRELTYRSVKNLKLYLGGNPVSHATALAAVAAYAPSGWTFTPDSAPPIDSIYGRFNGESVLAAAIKIAEKSQSHFYRSGGRGLVFANTFSDSGVRAIVAGPGDLAAETCAIVRLQETLDSYDLLTRIYPRGSGNGDVQLTLKATTRTAPSGYTLSTANNYIESDAGVAAYGVVEEFVEWREIGPVENTAADIQAASDMLFDEALKELQRRALETETPYYDLDLAGCSALLRPLQSVRVTYRDTLAGIDIDRALNILEATWLVDASGVQTTGVVVTTADRWPQSESAAVADALTQGRVYQALPQLNANEYVANYTKNVDETNTATFRFRFSEAVTQLQQVLFEFQLLPFESTVKAVGGDTSGSGDIPTGGPSTNETSSGGNNETGSGGTTTTNAGGTLATGSGGTTTTNAGGTLATGSGGTTTTGSSGTAATDAGGTGATASGGPTATGSGGTTATDLDGPTATAISSLAETHLGGGGSSGSGGGGTTGTTPLTTNFGGSGTTNSGGAGDTGFGGPTETGGTGGTTQGPNIDESGPAEGEVGGDGRHAHQLYFKRAPFDSSWMTVYYHGGATGDKRLYVIGSGGDLVGSLANMTTNNDHVHDLGGHTHSLNSHTHSVNTHTHTVDGHTHTLNNHTHLLSDHTHTISAHTHSVAAHTHFITAHTHAITAHTHTIAQHQHTIAQHTHSIASHTHAIATHTHSIAAHTHTIAQHTHAIAAHTHTIAQHTHAIAAHTHSLSQHTHTLNNHTHDLSESITAVYGIYREQPANTYALAELEYRVNSGAWAALSGATDVGSGWYRLDITAAVQDSTTLRPSQESNTVEIRGTGDKTVTIDAQLGVRSIIQAVAYV